ncbi:dTDP-4-dehydrorhamnose reductase [Olivibacter sp. SDN3]|uniref:dTDP-4-dehydrorhamnose reductase n=1 Tax=Olivibacter sp. SDN3 TaxID=2764720 RepID=UPI0016511320|nr:dTDP-4-dehydrorhamnose reductase [Olivibacter sp. SDN3]QNL52102.1 dTDP-4-dehydrorhamnose reductase [Olivibacter sp. SDN3]
MSKIVLGGSGQLGQCIKSVAGEKSEDSKLIFFSSKDADLNNYGQMRNMFEAYKPQMIINCAAYTAVDKAEEEQDIAYALNADAAGNLASLCKHYNSELIHISTDFVFEGNKPGLLTEEDITKPIGVYGKTKLIGEKKIQEEWGRSIILRTSWLYSEYGNNFLKTILRLAGDRDEVKIICDQVGTPTYGIDLARAILHIISLENKEYGIYHYSNEGVASWYDFAYEICKIKGLSVAVKPIKTGEFPTKAKRPIYSVMDKTKVKETFNLEIAHWTDSLRICLERLSTN